MLGKEKSSSCELVFWVLTSINKLGTMLEASAGASPCYCRGKTKRERPELVIFLEREKSLDAIWNLLLKLPSVKHKYRRRSWNWDQTFLWFRLFEERRHFQDKPMYLSMYLFCYLLVWIFKTGNELSYCYKFPLLLLSRSFFITVLDVDSKKNCYNCYNLMEKQKDEQTY